MKKLVSWLKNEESGQGMVEYGLIIAAVAIAALVGFNALGGGLSDYIKGLKDKLATPNPAA